MFSRQLAYLFKSSIVFLVVAFSAQVAVILADPKFDGQVNLVAPVFGISLGILLVSGLRYLPFIFFGALLPTILFHENYIQIFALPVGVVTAGLIGYYSIRLVRVDIEFERIRDTFLILLLGAGVSCLFGSLIETLLFIWGSGELNASSFKELFLVNWLAASVGSIIVMPFVLTWAHRSGYRMGVRQLFEVLLWFVTLIAFGTITFQNWAPTDTLFYPMELAVFPIMAWAAIRFGLRGASAGVLALALLAAWQLIPVLGAEGRYISQSPANVWIFVGIVSVTSICLASVMTELRIREAQIVENESRLLAFTSALPDIAFVLSENGLICDIFAATKQIQANHRILDSGRANHKQVSDVFEPAVTNAFITIVKLALEAGEVQTYEYMLKSVDVGEHWFEARVSPMADTEGMERRVVWVAYDITARKRYEAAIKQQDELLQATVQANSLLLTTADLSEAITSSIKEVCLGLGAERGFICSLAEHNSSNSSSAQIELDWRSPELRYNPQTENPIVEFDLNKTFARWRDRFEGSEAIYANHPEAVNSTEFNQRSPLFIPMFIGGGLYGFLGIDFCGQRRLWTEREINMVRVIASSISGILIIQSREKDLKIARDEADSANSAKGEFLAVMSHEIRTPINAVIGYSDLLAQTELNNIQMEQLSIVKRSSRALLDLINNILDYSKIESNVIDLESTEFNLEHVMCEALEFCLPMSQDKGLDLDYHIFEPVKKHYLGDPHRLRQILLNLSNNALKFTAEGGVSIEVTASPVGGQAMHELHFKVIDTGIGISEKQMDKLFNAFVQADSSTTREFGGTGLGLVISKRLVERMGGEIWVESRMGEGSIFHFRIPLQYSEDTNLSGVSKSGQKQVLQSNEVLVDSALATRCPLRILVGEDDPTNLDLICKFLERLGYHPHIATDGDEVLQQVTREAYDIILMDIRMPEINGVRATTIIRERESKAALPRTYIIAVTAYAMSEDRKVCLDAGMDDYMSKPIDVILLQKALIRAYEAIHA